MPFERTVNLADPHIRAMVCDALEHEEGVREVIVREPTRSLAQNRLYWVDVVEPLARWLTSTEGQTYTKDDVHHELKLAFLPVKEHVSPLTGQVILTPKSTTKLTKSDFSILMEKGRMMLAKLRDERHSRKGRAA